MPFHIKIHSLANKETIDAYRWYESQQKDLGSRYLYAIDNLLGQIIKNPEHFSILRGKYRHAKVKDFPFTIVFEFSNERKAIHISAIFHTSRNPRKKFRKEER